MNCSWDNFNFSRLLLMCKLSNMSSILHLQHITINHLVWAQNHCKRLYTCFSIIFLHTFIWIVCPAPRTSNHLCYGFTMKTRNYFSCSMYRIKQKVKQIMLQIIFKANFRYVLETEGNAQRTVTNVEYLAIGSSFWSFKVISRARSHTIAPLATKVTKKKKKTEVIRRSQVFKRQKDIKKPFLKGNNTWET